MIAVILAAGYATRLYPLTLDKPKCLLEVGGRSILDSLCSKLQEIKTLDEIVLVTNAKFYERLESWSRNRKKGLPARILNDGTTSNETRLGAIGDLAFAIREGRLSDDILMLASDNLFDEGLAPFAESASARKAVCTGLYDIGDANLAAKRYGVLDMDDSGLIRGIEEKPEHPKTSYIGMGIYYFPRVSQDLIAEYLSGSHAQDAPGHYLRWLIDRKISVYGFLFSGMWYDIGDSRALEEANRTFKG